MSDLVSFYIRAVEDWEVRLRAVEDHQWHLPTPDSEWDVHALVNHVVNEELWSEPLLAGRTIADVGGSLDGDLLGDRPKEVCASAVAKAMEAATGQDLLTRTVHVSFGDITGEEYLGQMLIDHTIHGWDLSKAVGGKEKIEPDLVELAFEILEPQAEMWRGAGVFGPKVELSPGADRQAQLLALTGRKP